MRSKLAFVDSSHLYWVIGMATILLPIVSGMLLTGIRKLNGLQNVSTQQRKMLLLATMVYQYMLIYLFKKAGMELFILPFYIGQAAILTVAFIINHYTKISLHAMGWGGFTGMTLFLLPKAIGGFYWIFLSAILISGLVLSARLFLGVHSRTQIYLGYSIAFILMAITFTFYGYGI